MEGLIFGILRYLYTFRLISRHYPTWFAKKSVSKNQMYKCADKGQQYDVLDHLFLTK